ncbi:Protein of unknown function (DUF1517) [Seminavis robusta]|uniref:Uncharacterized protein n=1 Tax=Seminavis robusta TaxID=568900 RepID=A0A9N8HDG7_9STRA|nr:Protein of unknown function (DUF1517) [Seminavis robusta]|eukprot:Sro459_g147360.1 Protein of unknown function (DUF1517) (242) ;mRNA; f:54683-55604
MSVLVTAASILSLFAGQTLAWQTTQAPTTRRFGLVSPPRQSTTQLNLFDKIFEEEGILGKGITVGKVQVALTSPTRGPDSIFGILEREANDDKSLPELTNAICLALMRKSDEWVGAAGVSEWYGQDDSGKAESKFNDFANREAAKFEKEYVPDGTSAETGGGATLVVVSLVVEIEGDSTVFNRAGYSITETKEVLASIASDCMVDEGDCLNAVEIFWCPSERSEVLTKIDVITDFPEIIDL